MTHKLDNNAYLKDRISKLEDWKDVYFQSNDMNGVDVYIDFDLEKLGVEVTEEELEKYLEDYCLYYSKDLGLYASTGDDAWYNTHDERLFFPEKDSVEVQSDFHLWVLVESFTNDTGYSPHLFDVNYHGYVDPHKFEDDYYKETSPEDKKHLENLLEIFEFNSYLEDHTQQLYDLPDCLLENLPEELKRFDEEVEVLRIEDIQSSLVTLVCSVEKFMTREGKIKNMGATLKRIGGKFLQKDTYGCTEFSMVVKLKTNSIRYILEEEKNEDTMSLLSVG